jgi:glycine/D-amino acid oxidase-like deaminating enzyme
MNKNNFDYCIFGAGLAGLSLAKELSEAKPELNILIVDPNDIAGGASGTPIGLVNPATGRYATKSWKAEEAVTTIKKNLKDVAKHSTELFYTSTGVIRPALDAKIAQRMQENVITSNWPEGWCSWMDESEIKGKFPNLTCKNGGVWVNEGATVAIPIYLQALAKSLELNGVQIITKTDYDLNTEIQSQTDVNWNLTTVSKGNYLIKNVIVTAGIKTKEFDFWKDLPLHPVKGQVSVYECIDEFPYRSAVSALGYFASIDKKTFVAGSTYEHNFDHEDTDKKGYNYIHDRLLRVIPHLKDRIELIHQWSGVRASTPDRMPIVGNHTTIPNCFVFAGLGSKGLLYSSLIAKMLTNHLLYEDQIPAEISITRY